MSVKELMAKLAECGEDNEVVDENNTPIVEVLEFSGQVQLRTTSQQNGDSNG